MNEFIKAEKSRISGMLASYTKQVEDITNEMLGIDAKYKAMAKKEKEALSASLVVLKDLIKGASKMYAMLGEDEEKTEEKVTAPVIPDEKTQVVDTLFPENNERAEEESAPVEEDNAISAEEEKPLDLGNMKQDNTVFEFEKDEPTEEDENEETSDEGEGDDSDGDNDEDGWSEVSQW